MNDGGDAGLVQRLANCRSIHIVIVQHQNARGWRLRAVVAIVMVMHGPSEPRGDEPRRIWTVQKAVARIIVDGIIAGT